MLTLLVDRLAMILMARFHGMFVSEDIAALDAFVPRFVQSEGPVRGIFDFTDVAVVAVPMTRFVERARRPEQVPGTKRIIVAPDPLMFGMAHKFQSHQELSGNTAPQVVRSLEEAYAAMEVTGQNFEPIDHR
ncbi:MAG: hypothetical protein Q8K93_16945 [Reyranella sp.]|uniref:hypothetical protein n=1 Tax=Reyranella sp. TaxID=1929291 RepID=UPI002730AD5B|nr:hypothetical protein [Reyranella sp.]MDP1963880.1 hypothetical protein [Reyranella sp.]MDP2372206.1 hypothetical protein [Reyranella sp.]